MADTTTPKEAPSLNQTRGAATTFTPSQYNIDQYQYPADLYSNNGIYGGNYVIFYVNVAEDSRLLKGAKVGADYVDPANVPPRLRGDLAAQNFNSAQTIAGAAAGGAITGAAAGAGLETLAKKGIVGVAKGAIKGAAIGAVPGVAGASTVAIAAGGKMGRQQKRLTKAIALHVPNDLSIKYSTQWDAEDTAGFQMGAVAASAPFEMTKALVTGGNTRNGAGAIGNIMTSLALSKGPQGGALSAASGLAANPKKENLFKTVDFRTFTFNYKFFPRNADEAQNVLNIIKEFKIHMHPEYKDSNNFVFIYPSEFDIYYYNNGEENLNLHRHTSCVLADMNVNYTPNGMLNTFDGGMPTQIDVSMTFKELSILTKQELMDGF